MSRSVRQSLIDRDHQQLSLVRQCILLAVSRASVYYRVPTRAEDLELMALGVSEDPLLRLQEDEGLAAGRGLLSRKRVRRLMRLMGRPLSNTMDTGFCMAALEEALGKGRPEIFNTDQGAQFTSEAFTRMLQEQRVQVTWMVRVGTWTTSWSGCGGASSTRRCI